MDHDLLFYLSLAAVGLVAGTVDAIAGGGGLLTLPALLTAGLSPAQALATNKLQSCVGTAMAVLHFHRHGHLAWGGLRAAILWTAIGAGAGALAVQRLNPAFLTSVIPFLLIAIALYFAFGPRAGDQPRRARLSAPVFALLIGGGIGFYDGFFGPGTGSFFALAFVTLRGLSLGQATAETKVLNLTSNLAALALFASGGQIVLTVGLAMAAGQLIGGRLGSGLVIARGAKLVRPVLIIICLAITARLVLSTPDHPLHRLVTSVIGYPSG